MQDYRNSAYLSSVEHYVSYRIFIIYLPTHLITVANTSTTSKLHQSTHPNQLKPKQTT